MLTSALPESLSVTAKRCRSVLMVGTHRDAMGGISSVVRGYESAGLFETHECVYVASHRDGSRWLKLCTALSAWLRCAALLTTLAAPLVHIHLSSRASFWRKSGVCLLSLLWRRPYVLHVHGSEFMIFYDRDCGALAKRFVQWIFAHAALVIALSQEWRERVLRICPGAKIVILPNAVSLPDLTPTARSTPPRPCILSLGKVGRRKGTFDLIRAFARVAHRFPEWRLVCAGDGAVSEALIEAAGLGLSERVECPGWLATGDVRQMLAGATLFALPSYAEGLPMALLEAMSWKLPVITSPVGGIPQAIRHGENGLLVPPGDIDALAAALESLMSDAAERERLGGAARATIEAEFAQATMVRRLKEIYAGFGISARE